MQVVDVKRSVKVKISKSLLRSLKKLPIFSFLPQLPASLFFKVVVLNQAIHIVIIVIQVSHVEQRS